TSALVTVYIRTNQPPSVFAADQTIVLSTNVIQMVGFVADDGLPFGTLSVNWRKLSGPTGLVLTMTNQQIHSVQFSATGIYQFVLSASDGQDTTYCTNTITVVSPNLAPVVDAGTNRTVVLAARYTLTNNVNATTGNNVRTSRGKEFWLGFPDNDSW